jgi:hypothetical protein
MVIVVELPEGQQLIPVILVVTCQVSKIHLEFLVDALYLAISLWVIGHQCRQFDPKSLTYIAHEFCYELGASVQHYCSREFVVLPDLFEVQSGGTFHIDSCVSGDEMCTLSDNVNDYHFDVIEWRGKSTTFDKVDSSCDII